MLEIIVILHLYATTFRLHKNYFFSSNKLL